MKKIIAIVLLLVALGLLVGCKAPTYKVTGDGDDFVEVTQDGDDKTGTYSWETEDGQVEGEYTVKNEDDWCQTGTTWSMSGVGTEGFGSMDMVIEGIVKIGEYAGYCHIKLNAESEEEMVKMDYYFDEDGNGYQVLVMNGQTMKSSWTKPN